jgi:hypothetical protein
VTAVTSPTPDTRAGLANDHDRRAVRGMVSNHLDGTLTCTLPNAAFTYTIADPWGNQSTAQ